MIKCMCTHPLLQYKSNKFCIFWVCVCSLGYPAFKVHVPYCKLRPVQLHNIFPYSLTNGMIFDKHVNEHELCVLIFSTTFGWNNSHSGNKWLRYDQICILLFTYRTDYSCLILMKLWTFLTDLKKKYSNIIFHQNPSSGSRVVLCGRTHTHTDTTKLIVTISNSAYKPKNWYFKPLGFQTFWAVMLYHWVSSWQSEGMCLSSPESITSPWRPFFTDWLTFQMKALISSPETRD